MRAGPAGPSCMTTCSRASPSRRRPSAPVCCNTIYVATSTQSTAIPAKIRTCERPVWGASLLGSSCCRKTVSLPFRLPQRVHHLFELVAYGFSYGANAEVSTACIEAAGSAATTTPPFSGAWMITLTRRHGANFVLRLNCPTRYCRCIVRAPLYVFELRATYPAHLVQFATWSSCLKTTIGCRQAVPMKRRYTARTRAEFHSEGAAPTLHRSSQSRCRVALPPGPQNSTRPEAGEPASA